jgi:hypothetical protein
MAHEWIIAGWSGRSGVALWYGSWIYSSLFMASNSDWSTYEP